MTTLMQFLASPLAHGLLHALGWTLLHFCWQGAIVAVILWSVLQLLAGRSSQARYTSACFALALLVALPLITFAHLASADLKAARTTWNSAIPIDPALLLQITASDVSAPWPARIALALDHRMPWLLALWLAGALFFLARLNFGLLVASRLKSSATEAPSTELLQLFDDLRHRLAISRSVRLIHSARVQVPTVIGWLRPVVLIPASCLTGLSTEQIEAIFCHELAHVRRHDYLVSVFQSIAESLLFYHPAVWWISRQVRRERECCCDEIAVANGGDVLAYAKALSYLEERRAAFPEFVLGANGGVLTMRIKRLLGCREDAPASQFTALALLTLMLAISGSYIVTIAKAESRPAPTAAAAINPPIHAMPLAQEQPAQGAEPQPSVSHNPQPTTAPNSTPQTPRGIYKAWLNEDAVYIITPEERAAYLNLNNDQERDDFINSFWARRNPPNSPPNTFRQEHYSRIAYANQHFASDTTVGWKSDRGRIYIVYGKPAEVDSHPSGEAYPYEVWSYPHVAGIGDSVKLKFVDTCRCGDYRYTIDGFSNGQGTPDTSQRLSSSAKLFAPPPAAAQQPPSPPHAIKVAPGVVAGLVISKVFPIYPLEAKAAHIQGSVVLHAIIGKDGSVENLQVISGPPELTSSALDAVKQWKYKPYLLNGQPVEVETTITVNFTLADPPSAANMDQQPREVLAGLRTVGGTVSAPAIIYMVQPEYTPEARAAKFNGIVLVNLIVDQNGQPQNVHILRGVGMGLDQEAVFVVKQYRFKPAMENGQPVPVPLNIEVNFQLDGATASNSSIPEFRTGNPPRKLPDGATAPVLIYQVEPEFTNSARKAKKSGTVLVNLTIDKQGMPQNVHVLRRLGDGLDRKAIEAVKQYRFKPAMKDNQPIEEALNVEINFQIF